MPELKTTTQVLLFIVVVAIVGLVASRMPVQAADVHDIAKSLLALADPKTHIPISHLGHPSFEKLAFLYDKAVAALILQASGRSADAEALLDYFDARLQIPLEQVQARADTNGVYGLLKLFTPHYLGGTGLTAGDPTVVRALVNALDRTSMKRQGRGHHEFSTTPGPTAFLLLAMAQTNPAKYADSIQTLREALRAMQGRDGGVRDGDRMPDTIHTEPHVNAAHAFLMASGAPGVNPPWPEEAEAAWEWFTAHVLDAKQGVIHQGFGPGGQSTIFATDAYTWTMAGPFGDRIAQEFGLETLRRLSLTLLHRGLVEITWTLPDGSTRTRLLLDFTDPTEPAVQRPVVDHQRSPGYGVARGGYHPLGSTEWTGGAILAFQKNAVRCWETGDRHAQRDTAVWFKALAEALLAEALGSFYTVEGITLSEYATGHNVATGHGWRTPVGYVRAPDGTMVVQGGSIVGGWPVLPATGLNPFIRGDPYQAIYDQIPSTPPPQARALLRQERRQAPFTEEPLTAIPKSAAFIAEPGEYNRRMFEAFSRGDYEEAIRWARRILVDEPDWVRLARRDQRQKAQEVGGLLWYPWGTTFPYNDHPLHEAIVRYPLLNEVGAAMWGLAASHFELGNHERAKDWIRHMIEEVPLHQIADTVYDPDTGQRILVQGYWNALVSLESNPGNIPLDARMGKLYHEVLQEMGLASAAPDVVRFTAWKPKHHSRPRDLQGRGW